MLRLLLVFGAALVAVAAENRVLLGRYLAPAVVDSVCVGTDLAVATIQALYPFQEVPPSLQDGPSVCLSSKGTPTNGRFLYVGPKTRLGIHRCASVNEVKLWVPSSGGAFLPVPNLPGKAQYVGYVATNWRTEERVCGDYPVPAVGQGQEQGIEVSVVNSLSDSWIVSTSLGNDPFYPANAKTTELDPYSYANLTLQSFPMLQQYFTNVINQPHVYDNNFSRLYGAMLMNEDDGTVAYSAFRFANESDCGYSTQDLAQGAQGPCVLADVFEAGYDVSEINWGVVNAYLAHGIPVPSPPSPPIPPVSETLAPPPPPSTSDSSAGPTAAPPVVPASASAPADSPAPAAQGGSRRLLEAADESLQGAADGLSFPVKAHTAHLSNIHRRLGTSRAVSTSNVAVTGLLCYLTPSQDVCTPGYQANCPITCRPV